MDVSWLKAQQDNQLAVLSNKFDFTLFKFEAPKAYGPLGEALGQRRKEDAEHGDTHKTARKLGALFEQLVPQTPKLIAAYGKRVSEIMMTPGINPKPNEKYGPFASFVGADATALWAAATSGISAIAMFLLATLLADSFDHKAASSLWVELIDCRKTEILEAFNNNIAVSEMSVVAAKQNFSREEIALWDNSARAWIQSANEAKRLERSQFLLIAKNIVLLDPPGQSTYLKVINLWKGAMNAMEELFHGRPQSIQDRCIPSAATAWHFFPNLLVLGGEMSNVDFKDTLVPKSATCTIGLAAAVNSNGVSSWSLALSHYRYYGEPIMVTNTEKSRITFEQFLVIVLGSVLASWSVRGPDISGAAQWLVDLGGILATTPGRGATGSKAIAWLYVLTQAAHHFLAQMGTDRQNTTQLIEFGMRRARKLLSNEKQFLSPFFGLRNRFIHASLQAPYNLERGISFMRAIAKHLDLRHETSMIVIDHNSSSPFFMEGSNRYVEFASIAEVDIGNAKRNLDNTLVVHKQHCCCLKSFQFDTQWYPESPTNSVLVEDMALRTSEITSKGELILSHDNVFPFAIAVRTLWTTLVAKSHRYLSNQPLILGSNYNILLGNDRMMLVALGKQEQLQSITTLVRGSAFCDNKLKLSNLDSRVLYDYMSCISTYPETASAFPLSHSQKTDMAGLQLIADQQPFDATCKSSLYAIAAASRVFETLAVSISTQIATGGPTLASAQWFIDRHGAFPTTPVFLATVAEREEYPGERGIPNETEQEPSSVVGNLYELPALDRGESLACLAHFEYGKDVISSSDFESVLALSIGNSIYVPQVWLSDPFSEVAAYRIQRIVGNIGHSGLSILVSPPELNIRKPSECYTLIEHKPYDMKRENNFKGTSLHLSFTRWRLPVENIASRTVDQDAYFVEAVISLRDRGTWVADLNFQTIDFEQMCRIPQIRCQEVDRHQALPDLRSIDTWEEVLDPPESSVIFRAHGNWAARLAAVTLLNQMEAECSVAVLGPNRSCFSCLLEDWGAMDYVMPDDNKDGDEDRIEGDSPPTESTTQIAKLWCID